MDKELLQEAFKVSKGRNKYNSYIAYIDPKLPGNENTFKYRQFFIDHGARWDGTNKIWYWFTGKTEKQWQYAYDNFIKPALIKAHKAQNASSEDSKQSLIDSLNAILSDVDNTPVNTGGNQTLNPDMQEKNEIKEKLNQYKSIIANIENDEEFKKTMLIISAYRNMQGYRYSFNNAILIYIQNPKAKLVKSGYQWNLVNRKVKDNAKKIFIFSPMNFITPSREEKEKITLEFFKKNNVKSKDELNAKQISALSFKLRGKVKPGSNMSLTAVYDIDDTEQIDGKKVLIDPNVINSFKEIKWHDDNNINDEVKPIYLGLLEFAKEHGIEINLVDSLGGAMGVSKSGKIDILKNEGNDVGLTKTLAHEVSHEILHQSYLKSQNKKFDKLFLGKSQGREMIEQQAELTAWIIMALYGFDLKTTSINYIVIWGGNKDNMLVVFEMISNAATTLVHYIDKFINKYNAENNINENDENVDIVRPANKIITPLDVAKFIGVESEYVKQLNQEKQIQELRESFYRLANKK